MSARVQFTRYTVPVATLRAPPVPTHVRKLVTELSEKVELVIQALPPKTYSAPPEPPVQPGKG